MSVSPVTFFPPGDSHFCVLRRLFNQAGLEYRVDGRTISLKESPTVHVDTPRRISFTFSEEGALLAARAFEKELFAEQAQ